MDISILRAMLAGVSIASCSGVLGCFVVWKRMSYFGDSLSHAALLGVVLGVVLDINITTGVILVCTLLAIFLSRITLNRNGLSSDAALGLLSHASLSFGILIINLIGDLSFDIDSYLFGDILLTSRNEFYQVLCCCVFVLSGLIIFWKPLILMVINEDLARAEGVQVSNLYLLIALLTAFLVAISVRIVGALFVTSMLITPASSARFIAQSPRLMVLISSILAVLAVVLGVIGSIYFDVSLGPFIVSISFIIFVFFAITAKLNSFLQVMFYKRYN
ncbi:Iron chelate uptake ABC transporter family permease subunit [Candidatus Xenohaliotis californiensis]|uniref:High-affinity zinc uptake system membrane protein ZnuB n=1 Tax=Candidatus Xenohaliotis californiensis TaxID=84677 RepID=A0ABP0ESW0_9RICK|nr:Iron chelate uptake ABC transporter family permease subunit [Candidatus Xenohaliotis californiensis]